MIAKKRVFHISKLQIVLISFVLLLLVVLTLRFTFSSVESRYDNRIFPHVFVNSIDVGGKTKGEVEDIFTKKNNQFKKLNISVFYTNTNERIATYSGSTIALGYDSKGIADRAFLIGRSSHVPSRIFQKITTLLGMKTFSITAHLDFNYDRFGELVDLTKEKYDKPAKNALFQFENGKVVSFRQEENGEEVDVSSFNKNIQNTVSEIEKKPTNRTVSLSSLIIIPEITLAEANEFGIEELIAEGKSDYTHSIPERIHNLLLATSKFNGILIPKDKIISFNDIVGDISSTTGYQPAYVIKNGKTVLGDGGGVCQVSTTLFRAALKAGLPILERTAHAYRVGYYENDSPPGLDATVFGPTVDLKIKNDTGSSILIETSADEENNLLSFKFYGKKDDRKIETSPVAVYDVQPAPPPLYQDDVTLKKGIVKQVDFAAGGAKAKFDYKVTKNNMVTFEKSFYSAYRPWQAIYLVGQAD